MSENLKFRVSSALKDILGRDLITDDFMAVFELVKNSYDAGASKVVIKFRGLQTESSQIIIEDNGKGMDYEDIINKWLFVAFSAKKEGTEDSVSDYRNIINTKRQYAGAKGIGRFSCDKLGKTLLLESRSNKSNSDTEVLYTEWEKFESDLRKEFVDIDVLHDTKDALSSSIVQGTKLTIEGLRSEWDRGKLIKLRDSLSKLINPNIQNEADFSIWLEADDEIQMDDQTPEEYLRVNGKVQNFIFDTLDLKTTKINCLISENGDLITTSILDGGTLIYRIVEDNPYNLLNSIEYNIYYLNRSAKLTFTKRMGLSSRQFGHIFLYKNGFRVYPYGEPGEDPLKIDVRKAQGTSRFLGTRDVIGQIQVNTDSPYLKETSSRGDGLIKTDSYDQLVDGFWKVFRRLERYVVDIQNWGLSIEDEDNSSLKERITELISKISDSSELLSLDYDPNVLDKLEQAESSSAVKLVENLKKLAIQDGNEDLIKQANSLSDKISELQNINKEIEEDYAKLEISKKSIEDKLSLIRKENELLRETSNDEIIELLSIEHHIYQATHRVDGHIELLFQIAQDNPSIRESIISIIDNISLENKKIASLVRFVTKANVDLLSNKITEDLITYIRQYIERVYKKDRIRRINKQMVKNVEVHIQDEITFNREFTPLEVNIIFDNLLDNSFKASSKNVIINLSVINDKLLIHYKDDGVGVDPKIQDTLFNFGVTTTSGSGIGLHHIKKITENLGGTIENLPVSHGAQFILTIPISNNANS